MSGEEIGLMPPLEALHTPVRLRMRAWSQKRIEWQDAVTRALGPPVPGMDRFQDLESIKPWLEPHNYNNGIC